MPKKPKPAQKRRSSGVRYITIPIEWVPFLSKTTTASAKKSKNAKGSTK